MKQQLTKMAIRESFLRLLAQKTFDKITVKSIVEDCGLTRNTFYYYYEDTYDILDDILSEEILRYSKLMEDGVTFTNIIADFCALAEANPNLLGHVLKSAKWDEIKTYVLRAVDKGIDIMIDKYAAGREFAADALNALATKADIIKVRDIINAIAFFILIPHKYCEYRYT